MLSVNYNDAELFVCICTVYGCRYRGSGVKLPDVDNIFQDGDIGWCSGCVPADSDPAVSFI